MNVFLQKSMNPDAWNYDRLRENLTDPDEKNPLAGYVNEVAKILAENDSYVTLAQKHWLEKMDLEYHDEVVYDYFKDNFPDLFD